VATPITDVDEFTDPITVPEDGDDRDALSVQTPFQGLANRTRHHQGQLEALTGPEVIWTNEHRFDSQVRVASDLLYTTPRDTNRYLHPAAATPDGVTWVYAMGVWTSLTGSLLLTFVLPLPDESIFYSANVCVRNAGTVDLAATLKVYEATAAPQAPFNLVPTQIGGTSTLTIEPGGTATPGIIDMSVEVDATHKVYFMTLSVTQPGATVFWGHVQYGATRATGG
jgi:hypothetical protein